MPLYEYQCLDCEHRFEQLQKFSDPPASLCPACGGARVTQMLSAPAVQFKGSGWYVTDYARKSGGETSKPGSANSTDSSGKADGKAESAKPEKSDSKPADSSKPAAATSTSEK